MASFRNLGLGGGGAVYAESTGATGWAVVGYNSSATGNAIGVQGSSNSPDGYAIQGLAWSTSGVTRGVHGLVASPSGYGVHGDIQASSGAGIGVLGSARSPTGFAVVGINEHATSGDAIGVLGNTTSPQGVAVEGYATSTTGTNFGVLGASASPSGRGVEGLNNNTTGSGVGVFGIVRSADGVGVYGWADTSASSSGSSWSEGVRGSTGVPNGKGVYGYHYSTTGSGSGVRGQTNSPSGYGVVSYGSSGTVGGQKNFINPHPEDPAKVVVFSCLEGNENGTYFRGTARLVGGVAEIAIPEEWKLASAETGITVQVTPNGPSVLWVETKTREQIVVRGQPDCSFDYFVNGLRRGWTEHEAIRSNEFFRPTVRGVPFGTQYPPAIHELLIESGILNPDLTPNETTAQRLGWRLLDPSEVPACERHWLSAEERRAAEEAEGSLPPSGSVVRVSEGGAKAVRAGVEDRR